MKPLKPEEMRKAVEQYKNFFSSLGIKPIRFPTDQQPIVRQEKLQHCYWQILEIEKFVDDDPIKAYGWICNIQGTLWASGFGVVDDYREVNRLFR